MASPNKIKMVDADGAEYFVPEDELQAWSAGMQKNGLPVHRAEDVSAVPAKNPQEQQLDTLGDEYARNFNEKYAQDELALTKRQGEKALEGLATGALSAADYLSRGIGPYLRSADLPYIGTYPPEYAKIATDLKREHPLAAGVGEVGAAVMDPANKLIAPAAAFFKGSEPVVGASLATGLGATNAALANPDTQTVGGNLKQAFSSPLGLGMLAAGTAAGYAIPAAQGAVSRSLRQSGTDKSAALNRAEAAGGRTTVVGGFENPAFEARMAGGDPFKTLQERAIEKAYGPVERGVVNTTNELKKRIGDIKQAYFAANKEEMPVEKFYNEVNRLVDESNQMGGIIDYADLRRYADSLTERAAESAATTAYAPPAPAPVSVTGRPTLPPSPDSQELLAQQRALQSQATSQGYPNIESYMQAKFGDEALKKITPVGGYVKQKGVMSAQFKPTPPGKTELETGIPYVTFWKQAIDREKQLMASWKPGEPIPWLDPDYTLYEPPPPRTAGEWRGDNHGRTAMKVARDRWMAQKRAMGQLPPAPPETSYDQFVNELGQTDASGTFPDEGVTRVQTPSPTRAQTKAQRDAYGNIVTPEGRVVASTGKPTPVYAEKTREITPAPNVKTMAYQRANEPNITEADIDKEASVLYPRYNLEQVNKLLAELESKINTESLAEGGKRASPRIKNLEVIRAKLLEDRAANWPEYSAEMTKAHKELSAHEERLDRAGAPRQVKRTDEVSEPDLGPKYEESVRQSMRAAGSPRYNPEDVAALEYFAQAGGGPEGVQALKDALSAQSYEAIKGGTKMAKLGMTPSGMPIAYGYNIGDAAKLRLDAVLRTLAKEPGWTNNPALAALAMKYGITPARVFQAMGTGGNEQ